MTTTTDEMTPRYPFGPPTRLELAPELDELRHSGRIIKVEMPVGGQAWLVTRYRDLQFVLSDPRFSRALAVRADVPRLSPGIMPAGALVARDAADHKRLRNHVSSVFTARRIEQFRPKVTEVADSCISRLVEAGPSSDFVSLVAQPLTMKIVYDFVGIPLQDREFFEQSAYVFRNREYSEHDQLAAHEQLDAYLMKLIAERRTKPQDALLDSLIAIQAEGADLNDDELANLIVAIIMGGSGSTARSLTFSLYLLMQDREVWDEIVAAPGLIPAAVDELLRLIPLGVAGGNIRIATEDVEVGGVLIRAGEAVMPAMISGNLDEEVFEAPGTLDIRRRRVPSLSFGHGLHRCLGSQLARLELQVALERLSATLPEVRLAVSEDALQWVSNEVSRRLESLPLTW